MTDTPWLDEPDELNGAYGDVPWALRRGPAELGHWCGYIAVPKGHPWHGREVDAEVHGGVTYHDGDGREDLPGIPGAWWVGFDCAHLGDLVPGMDAGKSGANHTYRTIDFARTEVERLARQAARAATAPELREAADELDAIDRANGLDPNGGLPS